MSDPLLTTLCTICHVQPPKYKCPRCGVRTCSLPCTRKHKAWASCSGERDPASFVPRERLLTDSGVDHDFNFIRRIERAKELFEKDVVTEHGLLAENEVRGPWGGGEDKRFEKVWYGDQLVHVPSTRGGTSGRGFRGRGGGRGGGHGELRSRFDQNIWRRVRQHDIEVLTMPKGLSRQQENKTAWNRRTNTINWQVEWFLLGVDAAGADHEEVTRICHKSLDEKPLYQALAATLEWYRSQTLQRKRDRVDGDAIGDDLPSPPQKRRKPLSKRRKAIDDVEAMVSCQDSQFSTWPASDYTIQCSVTSQWSQISSDPSVPKTKDEETADLARLRFFLLKSTVSRDSPTGLIPLSPRDTLADVLSGRTVVEFPTVYALAPDAPLPKGLNLVSTERRSRDMHIEVEEETNPNRAPLGNTRDFGRGGRGARGGHARQAQNPVDTAPDEAEEEEVDSGGDDLDVAEVSDGDDFEDNPDDESPEQKHPKSGQGLVSYSSGSDSD